MNSSLPSGTSSVQVYALPTGKLYLPDRWLFEDGDEDQLKARQNCPDFSFLIRHPSHGHVMFDLGMRKDWDGNPTIIQGDHAYLSPTVQRDAADLLNENGPVRSTEIHTVIFSHLHFDHTGDPTTFLHSRFVTGPGSREATAPGYPKDPNSPFVSSIIDHDKYHELSFEKDQWQPMGPFDRAHDFFGDGSFYLLDTPGHMPGHLSGLAHTGANEWIFMGGDCCHHRALLTGARPVGVTVGPNGTTSFHKDPKQAISTMAKVRELEKYGNVFIALAHDELLEGKMPEYPDSLNAWKGSPWKMKVDEAVNKLYG